MEKFTSAFRMCREWQKATHNQCNHNSSQPCINYKICVNIERYRFDGICIAIELHGIHKMTSRRTWTTMHSLRSRRCIHIDWLQRIAPFRALNAISRLDWRAHCHLISLGQFWHIYWVWGCAIIVCVQLSMFNYFVFCFCRRNNNTKNCVKSAYEAVTAHQPKCQWLRVITNAANRRRRSTKIRFALTYKVMRCTNPTNWDTFLRASLVDARHLAHTPHITPYIRQLIVIDRWELIWI